jgi:hypothetical protein
MKGLGVVRGAFVIVTFCCFGLPRADAIEFVGGPSPVACGAPEVARGFRFLAADERLTQTGGLSPAYPHEREGALAALLSARRFCTSTHRSVANCPLREQLQGP